MQSLSRQFQSARGAITSATNKGRISFLVVSLLTFFLSQTFDSSYAKSLIEIKSGSTTFVNSIESKKDVFRNIDLLVPNIVTTCISLKSRVHYILKSGECNPRIHESRAWYAKGGAPEGTPGAVLVDINICTSKKSGIQIVRKKCNSVTQTSTTFQRRHGQPAALNIPTVKMATLGSAFISFSQPSDDGGANITHYTISSVPYSAEAIVFSHEKKIGHIANLLPGTHYQFAVSATNSQGTSLLSAHTAKILAPNVPNKPTISNIKLLSDTSAKLLFQAPDFDGGSEITSYSAVMNFEGGSRIELDAKQLDTGIIEVSGLPYSSTFTITLFAHNVAGASLASEPSLSITTPPPPPPPPCQVDPDAILEITEAAIGGVSLPSTSASKPTGTTSAHGYSGSISWSFTQLSGSKSTLADSVFGAMRTYTATIQLTPDCPKGKIKVPSNFFTVSGASSVSNAENSGVITAVFPATGPGVPNKALIVTQPSGGVRGEILVTQPVIRVTDIDDNTNTTYTGFVLAAPSTGPSLVGTISVAAIAGIATFSDLKFALTGNSQDYEIVFTPASLISATSITISITTPPKLLETTDLVGTARRTAFTTQPVLTFREDPPSNAIYTLVVANVTASVTTVNQGNCTNSSAGSLIGTTTVAAINGVATFTDLGLDGAIGDCFKITFTSSSFGLSDTSATITLTGAVCNGSFTCQVGDTGPGGGKIFYYSPTGFSCGLTLLSTCKYLEAAIPSSDPQRYWSTDVNSNQTTAVTGADATAIGAGHKNSDEIRLQTGNVAATSAAVYALDYLSGGKDDWYLPSKDELGAMNTQNAVVLLKSTGQTAERNYWSSSESGGNAAFSQQTGGASAANSKGEVKAVRPIRAF